MQQTARFMEVETRAARRLGEPGGLSKENAIARADAGIRSLRDAHVAAMNELLRDIEKITFHAKSHFDSNELSELTFKANALFNLAGTHGFSLLQGVAESLLDLIALMRAKSIATAGGVQVHVMALAMAGAGAKPISPAEARTMMAKLRDVVDHFDRN